MGRGSKDDGAAERWTRSTGGVAERRECGFRCDAPGCLRTHVERQPDCGSRGGCCGWSRRYFRGNVHGDGSQDGLRATNESVSYRRLRTRLETWISLCDQNSPNCPLMGAFCGFSTCRASPSIVRRMRLLGAAPRTLKPMGLVRFCARFMRSDAGNALMASRLEACENLSHRRSPMAVRSAQ